MSAGGQAGGRANTVMVRVSREVYDELVRAQREILAGRGWKVSLSDIIKAKLAGQPVQP